MSKPAHTPGPWSALTSLTANSDGLISANIDNDGGDRGTNYNGGIRIARTMGPDAQANAAFIVRACNLVIAGKALQDAQQAKIEARGDMPPNLDWGLSEGEQTAALMMNALMEEKEAMLAALRQCQEYLDHCLGSTSKINPYPALEAAIAKAEGRT